MIPNFNQMDMNQLSMMNNQNLSSQSDFFVLMHKDYYYKKKNLRFDGRQY